MHIIPKLHALFLGFAFSSLIAAEEEIPLSNFSANDTALSPFLNSEGGLHATVAPGSKGYPGVAIRPVGEKVFDLSGNGRIEAVVRNPGTVSLPVTMRVDNAGHWKDKPFSAESIRLEPGETRTVVVFFGYGFGFAKDYPLDPAKIPQLLFFTQGADSERQFVIESVVATGNPEETPASWQTTSRELPEGGWLLGESSPIQSKRQLGSLGGATTVLGGASDRFVISFSGKEQEVYFAPRAGNWNLRESNHLQLEVANVGETAALIRVRLKSTKGSTFPATLALSPDSSTTLKIPFASPVPWSGTMADGEGGFDSRKVERIQFLSGDLETPQQLEVRSIQTTAPGAILPGWLGKQPPVSGEWIETFREEFDGRSIDETKWNVHTENHWDKKSHFSRDNVIVDNGVATIRFERRKGRHNDDPGGAETDYQTGFLDTFDKWRQRYGYFEARMKLPAASGLWPAFWTMPDRGPDDGPKWKRMQTSRGGMEFDIVEHLTRWGPYRYNIAFHWDGYGKGHAHKGTSNIYIQHDAEGFLTAGLLWLPEVAIYYCNGVEVGRWDSPRVSNVPSILMFTHVSGGWDNDPLDDAELPADFTIDYVRAWQRKDLLKGDRE